jgi:aspartyl-tRNA(Asn)/glutamyl-tRNA(Gln) amidotransferase subunit B
VATPIVEIKNMNSFRSVERAIAHEVDRQYLAWEETGATIDTQSKTTRGWDDVREQTFAQREKEESADYRYFPDPDLLPIRITAEEVDSIRSSLGELPAASRERLQTQYGIKAYDADVIVNQGAAMIAYYERTAELAGDGRRASSWIQQDVMRSLKERGDTIPLFPISADMLGDLLRRVTKGQLDNARARDVFARLLQSPSTVDEAIRALGIQSVDSSEVETLCRELLEANPQTVADYKAGKQQAIGALIGQAKKKNPNANPQLVRETLQKIVAAM